MVFTSAVVAWCYAAEILTALAAHPEDAERATIVWRLVGPYAPIFWLQVACNCLGPLLLLGRRVRRSPAALLVICIAVNVGMWLERFDIVVTSLAHDRLPFAWRNYAPSWIEWAVTFGDLGWFFFLFLSALKLLPPLALTELREEAALEQRAGRLQPGAGDA